jgi:hypothetical protein
VPAAEGVWVIHADPSAEQYPDAYADSLGHHHADPHRHTRLSHSDPHADHATIRHCDVIGYRHAVRQPHVIGRFIDHAVVHRRNATGDRAYIPD